MIEKKTEYTPDLVVYLDGEGRILSRDKLYIFTNRQKRVSIVRVLRPSNSKRRITIIVDVMYHLTNGEVEKTWRKGTQYAVKPSSLFEYTEEDVVKKDDSSEG